MFISPFPSDGGCNHLEFERFTLAVCHLFLTEEKEFGNRTMCGTLGRIKDKKIFTTFAAGCFVGKFVKAATS